MNAPAEVIAHLLDGAPFRSNQIHERDRWLIEEAYAAGYRHCWDAYVAAATGVKSNP